MKAISLWQPWASLWIARPDGPKLHETRHWLIAHRGWMAVHAAQKIVKNIPIEEPLRAILDDEFGGHWAMDLPRGAIIGAVNIIACVPTASIHWAGERKTSDDFICGDFAPGRFGWLRDRIVKLQTPIPWKGRQGIFEVPDSLFEGLLT